MPAVYMNQIFINEYNTQNIKVKTWDYKDKLESAGAGNAVIIPPGVNEVLVGLYLTNNGLAKVQVTIDPYKEVIDDPNAVNWIDWDLGDIFISNQDVVYPPTAIRQFNTLGTSEMSLVAHRS